MELSWRELTERDAAAVAELSLASADADGAGRLYTEAEAVHALFSLGGRRVAPVCFGAFAGSRLVAVAALLVPGAPDPVLGMTFWGSVHPRFRRRGLGTELVERAAELAPRLAARVFPDAPLELHARFHEVPGQAELAAKTGFTPGRSIFLMVRDLPSDPANLLAAAPVDRGLHVVAYTPADVGRLREIHVSAFVADHPGYSAPAPAAWTARFEDPSFRFDLSFLMLDRETGDIGGYVLAHTHERDVYLMTIATRREYRRRGVAAALIAASLATAGRQGFETASLNVDTENPSGALRVYERAGFTVKNRATSYSRELIAG